MKAVKNKIESEIPRRRFLFDIIAAATAPAIVPSSAIGRGAVAPSNRITVGLIGCGLRTIHALGPEFSRLGDVECVAACDVWKPNRDQVAQRLNIGNESVFNDFRDMLDRDDIDAVAISTPDHWHVPMSIASIRAGKDVYCEKPLSNTIREGRALVDCAKRYGAVFQHGTQLHSTGIVRHACELVRNGRIGKLRRIVIGSPPGKSIAPQRPEPVPDGLDYDLWLGPAPLRPYTSRIVFDTGWYFISDYSKAGWIAGYGVHDLDIAQLGMGLEEDGPIAIEGEAQYPGNGLFDTVTTYRIEYEYANGVKLLMTDTGRNRHGVQFVGDEGTVYVRESIETSPNTLVRESFRPDEVHLPRSPGHIRNFIDCVKSRAEPITSAEMAHRATSAALLGGIACQLQGRLEWDPNMEVFANNERANGLLQCTMRSPWQVV